MLVVATVAFALVLAPATVLAAGNTVTVTNPGGQTSTVGTAVSLQVHATDSASGQTLTYSATGLPAGLSINSSSGQITGTPTSGGTSSVTVTAQDTTGAPGSASFTWTTAGNTVTVTNPGDQTSTVGTAVSLQVHATDSAGA
jgi:Putative Ig domain